MIGHNGLTKRLIIVFFIFLSVSDGCWVIPALSQALKEKNKDNFEDKKMKNALTLTCLAVFLVVALSGSVFAQDDEDYERDVLEATFYGGLGLPGGDITDWNDTLGAKTGYELGFELGYFATESIVVGINFYFSEFAIDANDVASDMKHRLYNPNLYLKYYFPMESNFSPYVKGHVGLENVKFATFVSNENGDRYRQLSYDPALAFGFGAGLFYYTSDYSGLFLEANYHIASTSDVEANYEGNTYVFGSDVATFDIHAGIRVLIGSGE